MKRATACATRYSRKKKTAYESDPVDTSDWRAMYTEANPRPVKTATAARFTSSRLRSVTA